MKKFQLLKNGEVVRDDLPKSIADVCSILIHDFALENEWSVHEIVTEENSVIIPADLPEGSHIAPNGRSVIMVPVTFELCEEAYRLLSVYAEFCSLPYKTPSEVARWIVNGHCNSLRKALVIPRKEMPQEVSSDG